MLEEIEARFEAYAQALSSVLGHADRRGPMRDYCRGLMLPLARKSVEPLAAATAPGRTPAQHQSLMHFVSQSGWSDEALLAKVRELVLPAMEADAGIEAWIIDDTGFPKSGRHSVGVARQYCGQLGKQDNCQVAVSLSLASARASLPVAWRLYLPREWAADATRRGKVDVPREIAFATKPAIALRQLREACAAGLPRGVVLMDAGYGVDARLRLGATGLGLAYVAGVTRTTLVFEPGHVPAAGYQRYANARRQPHVVSVRQVALGLPADAWTALVWREGAAGPLSSRFARVRLRSAHRHRIEDGRVEEWLLVEWPEGEKEPTRYWLSTLPPDIGFERLVGLTKMRWRIERDYRDLKREFGLGHFEGRGWRGFHHHASLCIAAYAFQVRERAAFPPFAPPASGQLPQTRLPASPRSRQSAAANPEARARLHRDPAPQARKPPRSLPPPMFPLRSNHA